MRAWTPSPVSRRRLSSMPHKQKGNLRPGQLSSAWAACFYHTASRAVSLPASILNKFTHAARIYQLKHLSLLFYTALSTIDKFRFINLSKAHQTAFVLGWRYGPHQWTSKLMGIKHKQSHAGTPGAYLHMHWYTGSTISYKKDMTKRIMIW